MIKLSELESDVLLAINLGGDLDIKNVESFLNNSEYLDIIKEDKSTYPKVSIADTQYAEFSFDDMVNSEGEQMHEDWEDAIWSDVTIDEHEVLKKAETIINNLFQKYPTYYEGETVEIDILKEDIL